MRRDTELPRVLLAWRKIDADVLDRAVEDCRFFGGTLDTVLLERGVLSEAELASALATAWGTKPLSDTLLTAPKANATALFPQHLATALGACAIYVDDAGVHVAVRAPLDRPLWRELSGIFKLTFVPHVVTEVRLWRAIASAFGVVPEARQLSLINRVFGLAPDEPTAADEPAPREAVDDSGKTAASRVVEDWSLFDALAHLAAEEASAGVCRVALMFVQQHLPFACLLGVRDAAKAGARHVVGWARLGLANGTQFHHQTAAIEGTVLADALDKNEPFVGRLPTSRANTLAFGFLGRERPQTVVILPIVVAGQPVAVLVADSGATRRSTATLSDVLAFGARLPAAFERVLRLSLPKWSHEGGGAEVLDLEATLNPRTRAQPEPHEGATASTLPAVDPYAPVPKPAPLLQTTAPRRRSRGELSMLPMPAFPVLKPETLHKMAPHAPALTLRNADAQRAPPAKLEVAADLHSDVTLRYATSEFAKAAKDDPLLSDDEHWVKALAAHDEKLVASAVAALTERGVRAAFALGRAFPGRLKRDPFFIYDRGDDPLLSPQTLSPLLAVLDGLGAAAVDVVLPHLQSPFPAHRAIAAAFVARHADTRALAVMPPLLFDLEPRVQMLAARALMPFVEHEAMAPVLQTLRARATGPTASMRRHALACLAAFRDTGAVPQLIDAIDRFAESRNDLHAALRIITLNDCAPSKRAWSSFWQRAKHQPRREWLLRALSADADDIRTQARLELRALTTSPPTGPSQAV